MKIEDVEELEKQVAGKWVSSEVPIHEALAALRAEAWHPIEKAEELGAKDGRYVLLVRNGKWREAYWHEDNGCWMSYSDEIKNPTHFRFINSPEEA